MREEGECRREMKKLGKGQKSYIYISKIIGYGSLDAVLSVETKKEFERRREK